MKTVCIAGILPERRSEFKNKLQQAGFTVVGSVSQGLDYLVIGDKVGSKLEKARNLGVRIVYHWEMCVIAGIPSVKPQLPTSGTEVSWYDYDKFEAKRFPPHGETVLIGTLSGDSPSLREIFCLGTDHEGMCHFVVKDGYNRDIAERNVGYNSHLCMYHPIDWDKNKKKPVNLDWLVGSGIDCEFSNDIDDPYPIVIDTVMPFSDAGYTRSSIDCVYPVCRPRLCHWMVTDAETLNLIPEGFDVDHREIEAGSMYAVIINGLRDGYCWPWEV